MTAETLPPPVPATPIATSNATASPELRTRLAQRLGPRSGITTTTPPPAPPKPPEPQPPDAKSPSTAPAPDKPPGTQKTVRELDEPELEAEDTTETTAETTEQPEDKKQPPAKPEPFPDRRKADNKLTWRNLRTLQTENATLRQQLEEYKSKVPDPTDHPKYKEALTKLEAAEKRAQTIEKDLEFSRFERSPRFKAEYLQPILDANQSGARAMLSLDVVTPDGNTRPGTGEDWQRLMAIQEPRTRLAEAKKMFGEDPAALAVFARHEGTVDQLTTRATRALEEYQAKGSEQEKQQNEASQKQAADIKDRTGKLWQKTQAELMERDGKWFKPIDGDDEGNAMLQAGYDKMKSAFTKLNLLDPNMPDEERAKLIAGQMEVMFKGAAYDRLQHLFRKRGELMRQLKKELAEYKGSEPKDGEGRGVKTSAPPTLQQRVQARIQKLRQ